MIYPPIQRISAAFQNNTPGVSNPDRISLTGLLKCLYFMKDHRKTREMIPAFFSLIRMPVMAPTARTMCVAAAFMAVTGAGCRDLPCDRVADTDSVFRDPGPGGKRIGVYHTGRRIRP